MQFRDLKKQYEVLKEDIDREIVEVIESSRFIGGPKVSELEKRLAEYVGVKHCITCGNGTDALLLALMAWGIGPGDAVFVPDFTFFSSGEVVSTMGATPVFVDVISETFDLDPDSLDKAVKSTLEDGKLTPKAVVPVDLFGLPADFPAIRTVADRYGLKVLEDGAQGFGGQIEDGRACSFGDIGTTSFFPAKPLGCYGDGGAVFTDDDDSAALIRSFCVHGKGKMKYDNVRIGMNSRLDSIQAGILLPKFEAFREYEAADVNKVASQYTELLKDVVETPVVPDGFVSSWAQYTIRLNSEEERDGLKDALQKREIPSMVYYPKAMHHQEAFGKESAGAGEFPVTDRLCKTVLSLPMHPYLAKSDVEKIADAVKKELNKLR